MFEVYNVATHLGSVHNTIRSADRACYSNALTISSHIFLASPNNIIVLLR